MNIIFTVLAAFPIGYFVRQRGLAIVGFLAADALLFAYQTVDVLLIWMSGQPGAFGGNGAFGKAPTKLPIDYPAGDVTAYGVVNLAILLVGIGLTVVGGYVARRRAARRSVVSVG